MAKVKFLGPFACSTYTYHYGLEDIFEDAVAKELVDAGIAEYVVEEEEKPAKKSRKKAGE